MNTSPRDRLQNARANEGLVALEDKDLYSRTSPARDKDLFRKYAEKPELAAPINALVFNANVAPTTNRTDIAGIFIPDLIKGDLSTAPARLAGGGAAAWSVMVITAGSYWLVERIV